MSDERETTADDPTGEATSRRSALTKLGAGGAAAWAAPAIVSGTARAQGSATTTTTAAPGFTPVGVAGISLGVVATISTTGATAFAAPAGPWSVPIAGPAIGAPVLFAGDIGSGTFMTVDATGAAAWTPAGGPWGAALAPPPGFTGPAAFLESDGAGTYLLLDSTGTGWFAAPGGPWSPPLPAPAIGPVAFLSSDDSGVFVAIDAAGGASYTGAGGPWLAPFPPSPLFGAPIGAAAAGLTGATGVVTAVDIAIGSDFALTGVSPWTASGFPPLVIGPPPWISAGDSTIGGMMLVDTAGGSDFGIFGGPWLGGVGAIPIVPIVIGGNGPGFTAMDAGGVTTHWGGAGWSAPIASP